jgi:anti-sigma B factor antagonist
LEVFVAARSTDTPRDGRGSEKGVGFGISGEPLGAGTWVFVIEGEVDLACADRVRDALTASARHGADTVIVDLARCTFLDSSGLRALLEAQRELSEPAGGPGLLIAAPGSQPRRILEMTALETVVPIFATRDEAEAAAARAPGDGAGPASS